MIESNRYQYFCKELFISCLFIGNQGRFDDFCSAKKPSIFHFYFLDATISSFAYLFNENVIFQVIFFLNFHKRVPIYTDSVILELLLLLYQNFLKGKMVSLFKIFRWYVVNWCTSWSIRSFDRCKIFTLYLIIREYDWWYLLKWWLRVCASSLWEFIELFSFREAGTNLHNQLL